ncbi:hypothetical protein EDD73_107125 [Heliophilum fasciatum]|uniref:Uncharacterized protein n=2 Tax=Heliophilum fasciatum TaxID=35700 RepID=A0A4R2RM57_9FIRM|nr:hypothetical protein EDD73_107125 [Heliophilum fasciatum]
MSLRLYTWASVIIVLLGITVLSQGWNRYPFNTSAPGHAASSATSSTVPLSGTSQKTHEMKEPQGQPGTHESMNGATDATSVRGESKAH